MGVGAVNPNFLNPEGALLWLGALLDAHPECAHIHRLGFGRVCRGPFANSGSRQLDELLGEALGLEGMGGHSLVGAAISPHLQTWHRR